MKTESWQQAYAAQSLHPAPLQVPAEAAQSPVERPADDSNLGNNRSAQKHIVRIEAVKARTSRRAEHNSTKASCIVECLKVHLHEGQIVNVLDVMFSDSRCCLMQT